MKLGDDSETLQLVSSIAFRNATYLGPIGNVLKGRKHVGGSYIELKNILLKEALASAWKNIRIP